MQGADGVRVIARRIFVCVGWRLQKPGQIDSKVWELMPGTSFQNLVEPWMAEQSVHGRIHSVFWKDVPGISSFAVAHKTRTEMYQTRKKPK